MFTPEMSALARDFAVRLVAFVEADLVRRVQGAIMSSFPVSGVAATTKTRLRATGKEDAARPARRPARMSPKLARARKLQGQCLGAMRGLKLADRSRVKKLTAAKGVAAGLKLALSLR